MLKLKIELSHNIEKIETRSEKVLRLGLTEPYYEHLLLGFIT